MAVMNNALGPTKRELRETQRVVRAFEDAADVGKLELNGVVERPHYEQHKALLKRASDIND